MLDFNDYVTFQTDYTAITNAIVGGGIIDKIEYYDIEYNEDNIEFVFVFYDEDENELARVVVEDADMGMEILSAYFDVEHVDSDEQEQTTLWGQES